METSHAFTCPHCGYEAGVSGGDDAGPDATITTIVWHTRRQLYDVATTVGFKEPGPVRHLKLRCPRSAGYDVQRWTEQDGCPQCGATMDDEGPTVAWDWAAAVGEARHGLRCLPSLPLLSYTGIGHQRLCVTV